MPSKLHYPLRITGLVLLALSAVLTGYSIFIPVSSDHLDLRESKLVVEMKNAGLNDIENLVARSVEKRVMEIPGVRKTSSSSKAGIFELSIFMGHDSDFSDYLNSQNPFYQELKKILPQDADIHKGMVQDDFAPVQYVLQDLFPGTELSGMVSGEISDELLTISSVANVQVEGGMKTVCRIIPDQDKMIALGISTDDLRTALLDLQVSGMLSQVKAEDIEAVVLKNKNGEEIRITDFAEIKIEAEQTKTQFSVNGKPAILVSVFPYENAKPETMIDTVQKRVSGIQRNLQAGISMEPVFIRDTEGNNPKGKWISLIASLLLSGIAFVLLLIPGIAKYKLSGISAFVCVLFAAVLTWFFSDLNSVKKSAGENQFLIRYKMPSGTSAESAMKIRKWFDETLAAETGIEFFTQKISPGNSAFVSSAYKGECLVRLKSNNKSPDGMIRALREKIKSEPGIQAEFIRMSNDPDHSPLQDPPLKIIIAGDDPERLYETAANAFNLVRETEDASDVILIGNEQENRIDFSIDRDKMLANGFRPADLKMQLDMLGDGYETGIRMVSISDRIPVLLQYEKANEISDLEGSRIFFNDHQALPLQNFISVMNSQNRSEILRENGKQVYYITAQTESDDPMMVQRIKDQLKKLPVPANDITVRLEETEKRSGLSWLNSVAFFLLVIAMLVLFLRLFGKREE